MTPVCRPMHFNPRAPYGARPDGRRTGGRQRPISILAPLTGRDPSAGCRRQGGQQFQSSRPLRGATLAALYIIQNQHKFQSSRPLRGATGVALVAVSAASVFQSSRPLRGATAGAGGLRGVPPISILAPLAGRDALQSCPALALQDFNPRAPCGARLPMWGLPATGWMRFQSSRPLRGATPAIYADFELTDYILILAPLAGRDDLVHLAGWGVPISILAPLAGRDSDPGTLDSTIPNFNPRAPCGARRPTGAAWASTSNFNPRAPCGARPFLKRLQRWAGGFQSSRPLRGATRALSGGPGHPGHFNPRAPCGARRGYREQDCRAGQNFNPRAPCGARPLDSADIGAPGEEISILAPLAGRDRPGPAARRAGALISILAPLAGRDEVFCGDLGAVLQFQSSRPLRGATHGEGLPAG